MSKGLATAAVIVGSVALAATGVGALASAGILGTAAQTGAALGLGAFGTIASVGSIATAVAAGLAVGAQLTAQPPPLGGSATRFKADKDAGIPYVIGRTATGGNIIYRRTHNTTGYALPDLQTFGVVLSGAGPINAIESFQADQATVSFSGKSATGSFATWMFQATQLGQSPESAALDISGLYVAAGKTTSAPPGWTSTAKLSGLAAALWTLRYDQKGKFYAQGVPKPLWVVQGVKVYDPRLDSTYPGGSGACRAGTESTYVYSENPFLHALTFALGRYQNGKRVLGIGAPVSGIDVRAFVEGANVADANGWKVGGVITSADNKWAVLKTILQAGGGEPMHLGALLSCRVSTPRVTLATVTTDDLIGEARVTATTSRRDRFNTVVPRYRSEAHNWEIIAADPVAVSSHITTDGGVRSREITYSMVQDLTQVAELARYDIENAREFGPVVLPLKLRWIGYRPGDCIAVNLPEVGLNNQSVVIGNREIDAAGLSVVLTARSETDAKHPFALGQTTTAPPTPSVSTPPVPPQPGSTAWSLSGAGLVAGATVTPALIITGAAASVPIDAVVIEYRLYVPGQAAGVGWIGAGSYLPDVTRIELSAVLPATAYEIAVSYRLGAFTGDRRIVGPVTTTAAGLEWSGVGGTGRPDDNATQNDDGNNLIQSPGQLDQFYTSPGVAVVERFTTGSVPNGIVDRVRMRFDFAGFAAWSQPNAAGIAPYAAKAGDRLFYYARVNRSSGAAGSIRIKINFCDAALTNFFSQTIASYSGPDNVWATIGDSFVCPAGTAFAFPIVETDSDKYFCGDGFLGRVQPGADVTAAAQIVVLTPGRVDYAADYTGTIMGSLTNESIRVSRGGNSIKLADGTSYAITVNGGISATVDNTNGSGTKGDITLTAFTGSSGSIDVVVTVDGVAQPRQTILFTKTNAAPPAAGGAGAKIAYDASFNSVSATSDTVISDVLTVTIASGESLYGTAPLDYEISGTTSATRTASLKWQYDAGGGSWTDFVAGTYVTGSTASSGKFISGEWIDPIAGSVACSQSKSGLSAGAYPVRLVAKLSATGRTATFYGTATIEAKV